MERRSHKAITKKELSQPYFFSEWDYCPNCHFIQHYEQYKVRKGDQTGRLATPRQTEMPL